MIGQLLAPAANQIPLGLFVEYPRWTKVLLGHTHYHTQLVAKDFANDF